LACIDARTHLLPDSITLPLLWAGLLLNLGQGFTPLVDAVIGAAAGYLFLWSIYWAFRLLRGKEGMGYGDFKLLAALGAWFGWHALPQLILISALSGSIVGVTALLRGRLARDQALPFGPYLAVAGIMTLFFGDVISRLA
jgi:leader peptidase (prepilin peptidase)/N-methyltransferase